MSTMALKTLLNRLTTERDGGTFHNKDLKKMYGYLAPHTLIINKKEFLDEFLNALVNAYNLTDDQQDEIAGIIFDQWGGIVSSFANDIDKKDKNLEVLEATDFQIKVMFFNKQNYGRIDDAFFKNDARYSHFFKPLFKAVNKELKRIGKELFLSKGKLGVRFKSIDDTGISDYFNQGHYDGSSIHYSIASRFLPITNEEDRAGLDSTNYLDNPDIMNVIKSSSIGESVFNSEVNMLVQAASKLTGARKPSDGDFTKTITVKIESKTKNQLTGATIEADIRDDFIKHIKDVIYNRKPMEWINQEASDSALNIATKTVINAAITAGAKGIKSRINITPSQAEKTITIKINGTTSRLGVKGKKRPNATKPKAAPMATPSYLNLIEMINRRLPEQVRRNMEYPRLVNRTGRFSESTRVTDIITTPEGFPSIEYNYERHPYDVFDKTVGRKPWKTPARDPSELVSKSVREIVTEIGIGRFYTRRAQ